MIAIREQQTGWSGFSTKSLVPRSQGIRARGEQEGALAHITPEKFVAIAQALLAGATRKDIIRTCQSSEATVKKVSEAVRIECQRRGDPWPLCSCGHAPAHRFNCRTRRFRAPDRYRTSSTSAGAPPLPPTPEAKPETLQGRCGRCDGFLIEEPSRTRCFHCGAEQHRHHRSSPFTLRLQMLTDFGLKPVSLYATDALSFGEYLQAVGFNEYLEGQVEVQQQKAWRDLFHELAEHATA